MNHLVCICIPNASYQGQLLEDFSMFLKYTGALGEHTGYVTRNLTFSNLKALEAVYDIRLQSVQWFNIVDR